MRKLNLAVSDHDVEAIIRTAAGAPALLQEICLDVAEHSTKAARDAITREDIEASVRTFLLNSQARLTQRSMTVIETVGPKRYREQVLRAMAESPNDFVTMDELTASVSECLGEEVPATTLSGPLRELKKQEFGEILRDIARPSDDGTRVHNLSAFKDPRMKAFTRAMNAVEDQGLLPSREEVEALHCRRGRELVVVEPVTARSGRAAEVRRAAACPQRGGSRVQPDLWRRALSPARTARVVRSRQTG